MEQIENIFIFVSDSLRWDYLPSTVRSKGITLKTVAASCYSAPSFSSLSTGRYPQSHGVSRWDDQVSKDIPTIFDIDGFESGFHQKSGEVNKEALYSILRLESDIDPGDINSPFILMERDLQPHVPFTSSPATSAREYYNTNKNDWKTIKQEYKESCKKSVKKFENRLEILDNKDLLDTTLCIFTSDHGELLGEYGEAGHSSPATPELVYVPSTLIHPRLEQSDLEVDQDQVVEAVDIIETAINAIGESDFDTDGVNLLENKRSRDWAYNRVNIEISNNSFYTADSIWWESSGYTHQINHIFKRITAGMYRILRGPERAAVRRSPVEVIKTYIKKTNQFGSPPVNKRDGIMRLTEFTNEITNKNSDNIDISKGTEDRLKELGYLE